uniref:Uncharacterized protein n=1 Tax=Arundo donax TaxID=35708 RepID=A0A0A9SK71_ARUDO
MSPAFNLYGCCLIAQGHKIRHGIVQEPAVCCTYYSLL